MAISTMITTSTTGFSSSQPPLFLSPTPTPAQNNSISFSFSNSKKSAPKLFAKMPERIQSSGISSKASSKDGSNTRTINNFRRDQGFNYTVITNDLIVGSQPKVEDLDRLKQEQKVAYILSLQDDIDIEYWGIDLQSIKDRCEQLGIQHMRVHSREIRPDSFRKSLPIAVSALEWGVSEGKGRVYVHCTAGIGKSPSVAVAYLFWFFNKDLHTAYDTLTARRPCSPKKDVIREATYDLTKTDSMDVPIENLPSHTFSSISDADRQLIQDSVRALRGT